MYVTKTDQNELKPNMIENDQTPGQDFLGLHKILFWIWTDFR